MLASPEVLRSRCSASTRCPFVRRPWEWSGIGYEPRGSDLPFPNPCPTPHSVGAAVRVYFQSRGAKDFHDRTTTRKPRRAGDRNTANLDARVISEYQRDRGRHIAVGDEGDRGESGFGSVGTCNGRVEIAIGRWSGL